MHQDTFNADFYITAATVIPLLYITLTLQGSTYEDYITQMKATHERLYRTLPIETSARRAISGLVKFVSLYFATAAIWFAGLFGELAAILSLVSRSADPGRELFTLTSIVALLFLVAARPVWHFYRALREGLKRSQEFWESRKS